MGWTLFGVCLVLMNVSIVECALTDRRRNKNRYRYLHWWVLLGLLSLAGAMATSIIFNLG